MIRKLDKKSAALSKRTVPAERDAARDPELAKPGTVMTFLVSICSGAATGVAWVDQSFGWLALLGLAGFLTLHLTQRFRLRWHFLLAWLYGTACFTIATSWFPYSAGYLLGSETFSFAIGIAIWLYLGFQYALIGVTLAAIRRRTSFAWLAVPTVWMGVLMMYPNMFPFMPACLLTGHEPMLQLAEIGGVLLVSIYTIAIAGFIAWSFVGCISFYRNGLMNNFMWRCLAGAVLLGIYFWGDARTKTFDQQYQATNNRQLKIGLVQASTKYDVSHERMVSAADSMASMVDLMIWPENSLGNYSAELTDFNDPNHVKAHSKGDHTGFQPWPNPGATLLAGADIWQPGEDGKATRRFVGALVIDEDQKLAGCRRKIKLMPFGEFIPGRTLIPKLHEWLGNGLPISVGTDNAPLAEVKEVSIAAMLCCEDMFPAMAAGQIRDGGDLLVTIGNNIVFNSEVVGQQHFRIARFRAIENRTPMLRCMTTGVSGLVSPSGRIISSLPEGEDAAGVLTVAIPEKKLTLFTRWGNSIPLTMMAIGLVTMVSLQRKKHHR